MVTTYEMVDLRIGSSGYNIIIKELIDGVDGETISASTKKVDDMIFVLQMAINHKKEKKSIEEGLKLNLDLTKLK